MLRPEFTVGTVSAMSAFASACTWASGDVSPLQRQGWEWRESRRPGASGKRALARRRRSALRMASVQPTDDDDSPPSLEGRDWREVRAALQAGGRAALEESRAAAARPGFTAFPLAVPEVGCFLASHPAYYRRHQTYLTQAVVFITRHDSRGSSGLVLNRPLSGNLASLQAAGMFGRSCQLASTAFATCPVYLGGPDTLGDGAAVHALQNSIADVPGAEEPLPGVYTSSPDALLPLIESGSLLADSVRLFTGCISWGPGKLLDDVEAGEWFAASASKEFVTSHCIGLPTPLWKELMCAMSPIHERIAKQVYGDA